MPPPTRHDTLSIKHRLTSLLGPARAKAYWTALGAFLSGKVGRVDIEQVMEGWGKELLNLHNHLLLSILHNASLPIVPPSASAPTSPPSSLSKRKRDSLAPRPLDSKRPRTQERDAIRAIGKRERERLKGLAEGREAKVEPPMAERVGRIPNGWKMRPNPPIPDPPLCSELGHLPTPETLHALMAHIASDAGLTGGVERSAVLLLQSGLESHLKTILTSVLDKLRANRATGIRTSPAAAPSSPSKLAASPRKRPAAELAAPPSPPTTLFSPPRPPDKPTLASSPRGPSAPATMLFSPSQPEASSLFARPDSPEGRSPAKPSPEQLVPEQVQAENGTAVAAAEEERQPTLTVDDLSFGLESSPWLAVEPLGALGRFYVKRSLSSFSPPPSDDEEEEEGEPAGLPLLLRPPSPPAPSPSPTPPDRPPHPQQGRERFTLSSQNQLALLLSSAYPLPPSQHSPSRPSRPLPNGHMHSSPPKLLVNGRAEPAGDAGGGGPVGKAKERARLDLVNPEALLAGVLDLG